MSHASADTRWRQRLADGYRMLLAGCCIGLLAMVSCRERDESAAVRIGVLVPTDATPAAATMRRAMESYASEAGLELLWEDGDEADPSVPLDELERTLVSDLLVKHHVQSLVYTPFESSSGSLVLSEAAAQGVPIVALDVVPEDLSVPACVTTDYVAAGEQAARAAIEYLQSIQRMNIRDEINALVVDGSWRVESEREVATGFYNVLDATEGVRVVGRGTVASADEAFRFVGEGLNSYAGNVQLLLIASTRYVPGAILAADTHGLSEWLVSAGVGAGEESCRLILRQSHDFEVDLWPAERARLAIQIADQLAHGASPKPDSIYNNGTARVPVFHPQRRLISRENVALMADLWRNLYPE